MVIRLRRALRGLISAPRRAWRYGLVAGLAFLVGSATVVTADVVGRPIGSISFTSMLLGVATTPCVTDTLPNGKTTTTCFAVVNSNGELTTKDADVRAALDRLTFGADGSLKVAAQGTSNINGTVSVTGGHILVDNLPATQQISGAVNVNNFPATQQVAGSVAVSNLPATQPISGSVNVNNFPADQLVHGTVTVSNLPAATSSGVTRINLPTQVVAARPVFGVIPTAGWSNIDVSSCRSFSIAVINIDTQDIPEIFASVSPFPDFPTRTVGLPVDLQKTSFYNQQWAFAVQPSSTEPFYATSLNVGAQNTAGTSVRLSGGVFCQH